MGKLIIVMCKLVNLDFFYLIEQRGDENVKIRGVIFSMNQE
jgi:hypothetical protein